MVVVRACWMRAVELGAVQMQQPAPSRSAGHPEVGTFMRIDVDRVATAALIASGRPARSKIVPRGAGISIDDFLMRAGALPQYSR